MNKQLFIFCEGVDGVGKTEISKRLSLELDIPYFKVKTEKFNWENNSFHKSLPFDMLLPQFVKQVVPGFISDRCYISERVYSKIFNRQTDIDALWKIDDEWSELGAIAIILFRRTYKNVKDELISDVDDFVKLDQEYRKFAAQTKCHVVTMHVDDYDNDIERQIPCLVEAIEFAQGYKKKVRIDL